MLVAKQKPADQKYPFVLHPWHHLNTIVWRQCDIRISFSYILFGTSITFQIIAKDMNGSAGYLSSDALIELTIIDVNDETPTVNTMNTGSVSCVESQF